MAKKSPRSSPKKKGTRPETKRKNQKPAAGSSPKQRKSRKPAAVTDVPVVPGPTTAVVALSGTVPTPERPYLIERILTPEEVSTEYRLRRNQLDREFTEARHVLEEWLPTLKQHPHYLSGHITGWSVTFRRRFGHVVSPLQVVIAVNVATKLPKHELEAEDLALPVSVRDKPIKVLQGSFGYLQAAQGTFTATEDVVPFNPLPLNQPLIGGVPVGPRTNAANFGTLGIVIKEENANVVGLTNQHVIKSGGAEKLGAGFVPPGDASTTEPIGDADTSRQLLGAAPLAKGLFGSVDCGLLKLDSSVATRSLQHAIRGLTHTVEKLDPSGTPLFYASRPVDSRDTLLTVLKFGGRSGTALRGRIQLTSDATVRIGTIEFRQIIYVQHENGNNSFAPGGDSGSAMVLSTKVDGKSAFVVAGLFFAQIDGNDSIGVACHFSDVALALDLKIRPDLLKDDWDI